MFKISKFSAKIGCSRWLFMPVKRKYLPRPISVSFPYINLNVKIIRNYANGNIFSLSDRGIWSDRFPQSSLEFERKLASKSLTVYAGFDPTANSLHIGNLLVLNALLHFQRAGHKVIVLIGGATARIGDPSGKNKERPMLDIAEIEENSRTLKHSIEVIFKNHEEYIWKKKISNKPLHPVTIVNNYNWYKKLNILTFLRDYGKHMKMGRLLGRSVIESRLSSNESISYTEFSYQIMQAYDWLHLFRKYDCTVQVGGHDQMGNIMSGYELISRLEDDVEVTGITVPLIKSETGDKLGKSSGSPIWLSPERTSPFEFYQFFYRTVDAEVENYLKLLTFIPLQEIEVAMNKHKEVSEMAIPHKQLAEHLTLLVHGEEGLSMAKRGTVLLYGKDSTILGDMTANEVISLFKGSMVKSLLLQPGMSVLELAMAAGCFSTDGDALRIINAGGFYINEGRVTNPMLALIQNVHILPNGLSLLRVGKRNYYIVDWRTSGTFV